MINENKDSIKQLTFIKKLFIVVGNKKANTRCAGLDVSVESGLSAWLPNKIIILSYSVPVNHKQNLIYRSRLAVSIPGFCACINVQIISVRTPDKKLHVLDGSLRILTA